MQDDVAQSTQYGVDSSEMADLGLLIDCIGNVAIDAAIAGHGALFVEHGRRGAFEHSNAVVLVAPAQPPALPWLAMLEQTGQSAQGLFAILFKHQIQRLTA